MPEQKKIFQRNSYRKADTGEVYEELLRINSSHLRLTFRRIKNLADNFINFNSPVFDYMQKRQGSLGSVQAFICEQALSDHKFIKEKILPYCIADGEFYVFDQDYEMDNIYMNRLISLNTPKEKESPLILATPPETKSLRKKRYYDQQ